MRRYVETLLHLAEQRVHGMHVLKKRRVDQAGELLLTSFVFEKELSVVEADFNKAYRAESYKYLNRLNQAN